MNKKNMSKQEQYVYRHRLHHKTIFFSRILLFIVLLFLWEITSKTGMIDKFFFSSPSGVIECIIAQYKSNNLLYHISITFMETIISFTLIMVLSLLSALLLWKIPFAGEILDPYLVVLNSLPKSALAPLFIVWLGTGVKTIIIAGITVALFGSILSFCAAFRNTDSNMILLIKTLGGDNMDVFFKVTMPGSLPVLLSYAKINIGLALVGVIIGEFLAARKGLGYLIIYGSQVFKMDLVISCIILLCCMSLILYGSIQLIEHKIKKKYNFDKI